MRRAHVSIECKAKLHRQAEGMEGKGGAGEERNTRRAQASVECRAKLHRQAEGMGERKGGAGEERSTRATRSHTCLSHVYVHNVHVPGHGHVITCGARERWCTLPQSTCSSLSASQAVTTRWTQSVIRPEKNHPIHCPISDMEGVALLRLSTCPKPTATSQWSGESWQIEAILWLVEVSRG